MRIFLLLSGIFLWMNFGVSGQKNEKVLIKINAEKEYQVIHSFGASDAWRCQFVGKNWPDAKKERMSEWLFSKEVDDNGNPLGIGLSLWRFNIGAGSMEQGDSSGIVNPWRKSECFLSPDGTYDWSKQDGQQWFLKMAYQYGVENTVAFPNSAPVYFTTNGKAFSPGGRTNLNIRDNKLQDYARFLSDVCEHFEDKGLGFSYLSPFNEPQWDWSNPTQEGTPATNEDLYLLTHFLDHEFQKRGLQTMIAPGETAEYNFLYEKVHDYSGSSDQFRDFLSPDSPLFLGRLKHTAPLFSGHSYFTTWPVEKLINVRLKLRQSLDSINPEMDFWQSEFCILENNDDITGGHQRDLGMGTALYVARVMHYDLTIANATSWQWWTAITQCNYKDGLIFLDNGGEGITNQQHPDNEKLKFDGNYHDSKLLWAMGNFSRFVRPGMVRIEVKTDNGDDYFEQALSLMVSAFKNNATGEVALVLINYSDEKQVLEFQDKNRFDEEVKTYVTSKNEDLSFEKGSLENVVVDPETVKTVILKYKK
ncbi:glycoside hydrolase [Marinilabilia sp.]|uniref:glycoside hydrolase n=1 Tax=Marinilabilia sp. TaxID=2021252 RepID=UPI0025B8D493|nr:glycoside hydrolase [Marinilabilia sp.]